jgi:hypothetical protein
MKNEGEQLRLFIDNQPQSKISIAKALGMSKQNLFGLFKSRVLEDETKSRFENHFGKAIFSQGRSSTESSNGINKEPQNATPSQVLLEESIYNLTATQKINAMSIDRLVNILSQVFNSTQPLTAPLEPVAEDTVKASQGPQGDLALGKKYGKKNKEGTHQR